MTRFISKEQGISAELPSVSAPLGAGLSYDERLASNPRWALSEGSSFFEDRSAVQNALRRISRRLEEIGVPYAIVGGMALFAHGLRRFTEDVDILVSREGLRTIHKELAGRGYVEPFTGSKNLRDAEQGVRIEFLVAGQYPGDGKPKPVAFPDPAAATWVQDGIRYLNLPVLVKLKLASGMTSPDRMKDLTDVQELIKLLALPADFAEKLNSYVRGKYTELWNAVHQVPKRYVTIWRNKFLTLDAQTIDDMVQALHGAAATLEAMRADGVTMDPEGGTADDYALLITTDPDIAKKYDMHDESEFWDAGEAADDTDRS